MFSFELNNTQVVAQLKIFDEALSTSDRAAGRLRKLVRKEILAARAEVVRGIRFKDGDPRGARQAIRTTVYKRVFGGNLNIFNSRKAHGSNSYQYEYKRMPGQRGGNRRKRSGRTARIMSYAGIDRGFILRWLNTGTSERSISFRSDERRGSYASNSGHRVNTGNRGRISGSHFFRSQGERALARMAERLSMAIEEELSKMLNNKNDK